MKKFAMTILAMALAFSLGLASCDNGTTGGGISGSYQNRSGVFITYNFMDTTINPNTYTFSHYQYLAETGTFRVSGSTITCTVASASRTGYESMIPQGTTHQKGDVYTLTIINATTLYDPGADITYTKTQQRKVGVYALGNAKGNSTFAWCPCRTSSNANGI